MATYFLSKNYVAASLLEAKYDFYKERFITFSEFNQFDYYIQQEFNRRDLDVVINSDGLSREDFEHIGDVIIPSSGCCFNLDRLPVSVSYVLKDKELIAKFFIDLESEKLKTLENVCAATRKLQK